MNETVTITADEVEALGAKLDGASLDDHERDIVMGVFALAARALDADQEVAGFAATNTFTVAYPRLQSPLKKALSTVIFGGIRPVDSDPAGVVTPSM
jgi:hypothetical protein